MRALIFGGRGMLAQALAGALRGRGHAPVALAHADVDVTELDGVRRAVREQVPDVLFNCAGYTRVDQAEAEAGAAYAVNGGGARNVAVAAAEGGLPVVHISSDYVFDGASGAGYREWDSMSPPAGRELRADDAAARRRTQAVASRSGHCTWQRFAETIFKYSGLAVEVEPITTAELHRAARRPLHAVLMNEMWQADGRAPLRTWEEALADFLHGGG